MYAPQWHCFPQNPEKRRQMCLSFPFAESFVDSFSALCGFWDVTGLETLLNLATLVNDVTVEMGKHLLYRTHLNQWTYKTFQLLDCMLDGWKLLALKCLLQGDSSVIASWHNFVCGYVYGNVELINVQPESMTWMTESPYPSTTSPLSTGYLQLQSDYKLEF